MGAGLPQLPPAPTLRYLNPSTHLCCSNPAAPLLLLFLPCLFYFIFLFTWLLPAGLKIAAVRSVTCLSLPTLHKPLRAQLSLLLNVNMSLEMQVLHHILCGLELESECTFLGRGWHLIWQCGYTGCCCRRISTKLKWKKKWGDYSHVLVRKKILIFK